MSAILATSDASSRGRTLAFALTVSCVAARAALGGTMAHAAWLWLHWIAKPLTTQRILGSHCAARWCMARSVAQDARLNHADALS
ncbi:MAG: hypothetical protein ABI268_08845 [Rhodanobacter sp.]